LKPANVMCLECHGPASPNGPTRPQSRHTLIIGREAPAMIV
jgi:hypothetical protein